MFVFHVPMIWEPSTALYCIAVLFNGPLENMIILSTIHTINEHISQENTGPIIFGFTKSTTVFESKIKLDPYLRTSDIVLGTRNG